MVISHSYVKRFTHRHSIVFAPGSGLTAAQVAQEMGEDIILSWATGVRDVQGVQRAMTSMGIPGSD